MNNLLKTIGSICLCLFLLSSCQSDKPTVVKAEMNKKEIRNTKAAISDISPAQLNKMLQAENRQFKILDVRTPDEIKEGAIEGHIAIDFKDKKFRDHVNELDKKTPYVVYCKGGVRSKNAAEIMAVLGFEKVMNLEGGYDALKDLKKN